MLFHRSSKNKHFQRSHILDVKLRANQVRRQRVRSFLTLLTLLTGLGLGTLFAKYTVSWLAKVLVLENQLFALQTLDLQTNGHIPTQQLRKWANVDLGINLFALDLTRIARNLELVPTIEQATVERVLPHTLIIRVIERHPIARLTLLQPNLPQGSTTLLLDKSGFVITPLDLQAQTRTSIDSLPALTGLQNSEIRPGRPIQSDQIQAALTWLQMFRRSPMTGLVRIHSIDLATPQILQVRTTQPSEITFGLDKLHTQFQRWLLVHQYAQNINRTIASLDLSVANNVPARWTESPLAPNPQPPNPKTTQPKKPHV